MARIALFDGNALVHRAYHAVKPLTTSRGELTNAVFGFATMLLKTFGDFHPEYGAVAFDKRAPTFRHEAYPDYKANRARMAEDLAPQFDRVRELVDAFGMPIFELAGYEADDLLGTLARQALERGLEVYVVTGDTDALQLVRPGVRVFTPSRGIAEPVLYHVEKVRERYGSSPSRSSTTRRSRATRATTSRACPASARRPPSGCCSATARSSGSRPARRPRAEVPRPDRGERRRAQARQAADAHPRRRPDRARRRPVPPRRLRSRPGPAAACASSSSAR